MFALRKTAIKFCGHNKQLGWMISREILLILRNIVKSMANHYITKTTRKAISNQLWGTEILHL